jgi:hypothetical protein
MRKYAALLLLSLVVLFLTLSACERSQSTPPPEEYATPTIDVLTLLPDALASQTAAPTAQAVSPTALPAEPTSVPPTETEEQPEATTAPTLEPLEKTPKPETPTPSGSEFDHYELYGDPTMVDPMNSSNVGNWQSGGVLPDSEYLRISLDKDQIYVTGKKPGFSTWFFSWPTLKDFYLELDVNSEDCSGKDEYGLIVRGPAHGAGVSYGYIIAFSCDGHFRVTRLDSADPFTTVDLVAQRMSDHIQTGSDKNNLIGVQAVGKKLTVFANGYQIAEVNDSTFLKGRYGLFVQAVDTPFYTYRPEQLAHWDLTD